MCTFMSHSIDLRRRVLAYVEGGGSKAEAARLYKVGRTRIYEWLKHKDNLSPQKPGPKGSHKIDLDRLRNQIRQKPDATLHELAIHHKVHYSTIHYALKRLNVTRKKNVAIF